MGVLHNTSQGAQQARRRLLQEAQVKRIINLSDLCFQLFDGAQRPTAFVLYAPSSDNPQPYRFEYWVPKADLNLRLKRLITLSRADRIRLRSDLVGEDSTLFKRRLWTRAPEEKLLQYLRTISPLSTFIREYKEVKKAKLTVDRTRDWIIGQGFKTAQEDRLSDPNYKTTIAEIITYYPYLDANAFRALVLPTINTAPWFTQTTYRAGFAEGFIGPHILLPQGVERSIGRVRAAYCEQNLVFQASIQAIAFPASESRIAKILTTILNSSLAAWVYFHDTANLGADRAKVHQCELLKLPFDIPENMPDPKRAVIAGEKIVQLIDQEIANAHEFVSARTNPLQEIDALAFKYYGLDAPEIVLIEDTFHYIISAMQPRRSAGLQKIWDSSRFEHRSAYAAMLCSALERWLRQPLSTSLVAKSSDIAIFKLTINAEPGEYKEESSLDVERFLQSIQQNLSIPLPGNVQLLPDLRFVIGSGMYLVKPMQLRYWLRSTALADAEQIAEAVEAVWPICIGPLKSKKDMMTHEDHITEHLVRSLIRTKALPGRIIYQYHLLVEDQNGDVSVSSKIDFVLTVGDDDDVYLACECKRLNVPYKTRTRGLANEYINDGLIRFSTGQYSNGLPLAMMLGYVMNAQIDQARHGVKRAMARRATSIGLLSDRDGPAVDGRPLRFYTTHMCVPGHVIEVNHTFLVWP